MPWSIRYSSLAEKQLSRLSPEIERRIRNFMDVRVVAREEPRVIAKKLSGSYEDKIRFRVGDYRVICEVQDHLLFVLVVEVAHRREIYR